MSEPPTWRLFCPGCEHRRFHDPTDRYNQTVECRTCGSEAELEARKATSRIAEPNPDNNTPTLWEFDDEEGGDS